MTAKGHINPADPSRLRLVGAATRLFAQHGIDGVTLKDIVAAAGQKNQSAIQYHFGDKDGLIAAALGARFQVIDARRVALIAAAGTAPPAARRQAVMRATVEPLVEEAEGHPDGPDYIRFVAQAIQRPDFDPPAIVANKAYPGFVALNAAIARERATPWSRAESEQRIRICARLTIAGVADWVAHDFGPMKRDALIAALARANEAILLG
jgi:AcrR family transcriptional regulator